MNYRGARDEVSFGILFLAIFWFEVLQYNPTTDKWSQIGKVKRGTLYGHAIIEANLRAVCPVGNENTAKKSTTKKYAKQIPKTGERDDRQAVPGLVEQFEQKRLIEDTLLLPLLLLLLLLLLVLAAVVRVRRFNPNTAEENIDQI